MTTVDIRELTAVVVDGCDLVRSGPPPHTPTLGRILMPGEREEFRIAWRSQSGSGFQWVCDVACEDRGVSDAALRYGRAAGITPVYRIRVIWKAPKMKLKRDLWVRPGSDAPWSAGYAIMDGSDLVEGGFEYRSSAEDRMRELMEEGR